MRHLVFAAVSSLALAACSMSGQDNQTGEETTAPADAGSDYGYDTYGEDNLADTMASNDSAAMRDSAQAGENASNMGQQSGEDAIPDSEERPIMQAQVVLDRIGFGPGVIDGKMGMSTENALMGFQEANDLETSGELDEATKRALAEWDRIPATRVVTIPENWGDADYE
ncbi:MAG: peptidoglycan-binding domain-containing protein, partial [Pseudomonadota bacterium]|nr:peptidoglycan-binding domain-containing protein [Pseudomonadota bacterium]